MTRPWPVTENEFLLDDALDIAMRYFDQPPDSAEYASVEKFAVDAIMDRPQPRRLHQVLVFAGRSIEASCPSSRRARLHHPHGIRSSDKRRWGDTSLCEPRHDGAQSKRQTLSQLPNAQLPRLARGS